MDEKPASGPTASLSRPVSFVQLASAVLRRRALVAGIVGAGTLAGIAFSLLATPRFEAESSFMPPSEDGSSATAMLAQFGGLMSIGGGSLGISDPAHMYVGIIGSREIRAKVAARFRLDTVYHVRDADDLLEALAGRTNVSAGKDGIIRVDVTDVSPSRAARIANAYVELLQSRLNEYGSKDANSRRTFYEGQLAQIKERLSQAEIALKDVQVRSGVLEPTGEATMTLSAIADLRAQLAARQIELKSTQGMLTTDNPRTMQLRDEVDAIRRELSTLKNGGGSDALVHADKLPEASVSYYRAYREVKYQEALFEIISKQYELAKLDGERQGTELRIVDSAAPPSKRSFPKRTLTVAAFFVASGVISVVLAYLLSLWGEFRATHGEAVGAIARGPLARRILSWLDSI